VEHHAGDLAAADRDRHTQRRLGQLGVVVLAEGEPDNPPRVQVLDRGQIQLALVVGDLGQVPDPAHVRLSRRSEVAPEQVGAGSSACPLLVTLTHRPDSCVYDYAVPGFE
jgi:hypothetical protein